MNDLKKVAKEYHDITKSGNFARIYYDCSREKAWAMEYKDKSSYTQHTAADVFEVKAFDTEKVTPESILKAINGLPSKDKPYYFDGGDLYYASFATKEAAEAAAKKYEAPMPVFCIND